MKLKRLCKVFHRQAPRAAALQEFEQKPRTGLLRWACTGGRRGLVRLCLDHFAVALMVSTPAMAAADALRADGAMAGQNTQLLADDTGDNLPSSKDELFGTSPEAAPPKKGGEALPASKDSVGAGGTKADGSATPENTGLPSSKEDLFGTAASGQTAESEPSLPLRGFFETEAAYTYGNPTHWSDVLGRLQLGTQGHLSDGINWKVTGRAEYNAVYSLTNYYSDVVGADQRDRFRFDETYLDFSAGGLDWRVGRQQIVWGEMVGLFFADVVSAKDLREFILPDFDVLRIPQWAARAEYFKDDFHAELIWIPVATYDDIGTPIKPGVAGAGSDFYPYPVSPAGAPDIMDEEKPGNGLNHGNYGLRLSQLTNGWDMSGFWYGSMDSQPTFYRDALNPQIFYPRHDRIWQAGGTLAKDLGSFVLKAETVYTDGRKFNLTTLADGDGLVTQNTLDWVVGLDFNPTTETRFNAQLFQRVFFDHNPDTIFDTYESGVSLLANHKFAHNWEAEALLIHSLNRDDWMLRPKVTWRFQPDWRMNLGVDVFSGPATGLFGQYDNEDRVYTELRRDF